MKNSYFLLRHGETPYQLKKEKIIYPWPEKKPISLTRKGREQAKKAAKVLKKKNIDLIFSSDVTRARQTAEIVAKELGLGIKFDKRLRDGNWGIYLGKPRKEFHRDFPISKTRFKKRPPGGENYNDVKKRMLNVVKELEKKYKDKNIIIISHGDPLWLLEGRLRGLSEKELLEIKIKNKDPKVGEFRELC